jgi:hypothetical protein
MDQKALDEINQRMKAQRNPNPLLFVCRAQILARRGEWAKARNDIHEYFRRHARGDLNMFYEACLMRGFILEALGDHKEARESWNEGYRAASGSVDMGIVHVAIMASLSENLTSEDAQVMVKTILGWLPQNVPVLSFVKTLGVPYEDVISAARTAWSSRRGKEIARRIALLDCTYSFLVQMPVCVVGAEIMRYGAFGSSISQEDDELLWDAAQNVFRDYQDHRINDLQLVGLPSTWIGISNPMTWGLVSSVMRRESRGPMAYVMGRRYLRLGRPGDAQTFFQTALKDSTPDSLLRRRAQAALDQLNASK